MRISDWSSDVCSSDLKVANMLVPGTDLIHDTLEEAAGRLEGVQRHAQSSLTLVVDQELDIAGWPSRQPLRRLEEASRNRRVARVQHLSAPTRIARAAAAAFLDRKSTRLNSSH